MRKLKILTLILLCFITLSGCFTNGYINTLYSSNQLNKENRLTKKVILINPSFKAYEDIKKSEEDISETLFMKEHYASTVDKVLEKSNIKYEVYSQNKKDASDVNYYTDLLPLQHTILQAINNQQNPLNEIYNSFIRKIAVQEFVINTFVPAETAALEKKYGTPYFGLLDIYSEKNKSYIIYILVDVSRGIVTYQQIKEYQGRLKKKMVLPLIYDTIDSYERLLTVNKSK